jgi:hypothetical protein
MALTATVRITSRPLMQLSPNDLWGWLRPWRRVDVAQFAGGSALSGVSSRLSARSWMARGGSSHRHTRIADQ